MDFLKLAQVKEICPGTRSVACGSFGKKMSTNGCEAVVAQKSTKTAPRNDVEKNMSEVNLFRIKGDTVQDLEDEQNQKGQVMICRRNQRRCRA